MLSSKIKMLIAIIVPILLVLSGGIYWFTHKAHKYNIQVKEGHLKFKYTIVTNVTNINQTFGYINTTPTVTTIINNREEYATFKVVLDTYSAEPRSLEITMNILAEASLGSNYSSNSFIFSARELDNLTTGYEFQGTFLEAHNATVWNENEDILGAWAPHKAYIGFTPQSNNFNASSRIIWNLFNLTYPHTYTLKLEALCKIECVEVPVIIDIAIKTRITINNQ